MSQRDEWGNLEPIWRELDPGRGAAAPPGFRGRVMSRVRAEAGVVTGQVPSLGQLRWAPAWAKAAAGLALAVGLALGVALAGWVSSTAWSAVDVVTGFGEGLGDGYWTALETEDPSGWSLPAGSVQSP